MKTFEKVEEDVGLGLTKNVKVGAGRSGGEQRSSDAAASAARRRGQSYPPAGLVCGRAAPPLQVIGANKAGREKELKDKNLVKDVGFRIQVGAGLWVGAGFVVVGCGCGCGLRWAVSCGQRALATVRSAAEN